MRYITAQPQYSSPQGKRLPTGKTATLSFRIEPAVKEALRTAADREHRSIANMVEVLIRDDCRRTGISIPEQGAIFPGASYSQPSSKE